MISNLVKEDAELKEKYEKELLSTKLQGSQMQ
jgi:hypothetical protein